MADNRDVYLRIVAEWRAVVDAVRATRCEVITLPVVDLQLILDCCDPAWIATSDKGVRALAVPVRPIDDDAAPVAPGAADPNGRNHNR